MNRLPHLVGVLLPRAVVGAALAAALVGCADGEPSQTRLDVAEPSKLEESDEDWIRKKELLQIKVTTTNLIEGTVTTADETTTAAGALQYIKQSCLPTENNSCPLPDYTCARNLLTISTAQSDPIVLNGISPQGHAQEYIFTKVTEANAAEFAQFAIDFARYSIKKQLGMLAAPDSRCRDSTGWADRDGQSMAHLYAAAVAETYNIGLAAYERAIEATLNVADASRSSTTSPTEAGRRSLLLPKFSRSAAAHLLVGGDDGVLGSSTRGYCSVELAPSARNALELLRDAAPPPRVILDPAISTDWLLHGAPGGGFDSVWKRLASIHEIPALGFSANGGGLVTGAQNIPAYYGLTEADFTEARKYLQQEIEIFGRSREARLPSINGIERAAGSAGLQPSPLPDGAWTARARFVSGANRWYDVAGNWPLSPNGVNPVIDSSYRTPPLDMFIGEVHAKIRDLIRTTTDPFSSVMPVPPSSEDQKEVLGVIGSILLADDYKGAVELLVPSDKNYVRAVAHGFTVADKVRVVVGDEGLRCATIGNIEGADCNDLFTGALYGSSEMACASKPSLSCLTINIPTTASPTNGPWYFGTTSFIDGQRTLSTTIVQKLIDDKTPLYFVRPKPGLTEKPGNFELLSGASLRAPATGTRWNAAYPIVPRVNARMAEILAPNRKNCVENDVSCLGVHMDARLPLEDELTDDGNGFENSWRHYLTLARQAAEESALLGREFRDAKLNQLQGEAAAEQRREEQRQAAANSLQEVQNMCGTALDPTKLLEFLSRQPSNNARSALQTLKSVVKYSTSCPNGRCGVTPLAAYTAADLGGSDLDANELKRFTDCIDDSDTSYQAFVTLGKQPYCFNQVGSEICPSGSTCYTTPPCASGHSQSFPLGYFPDALTQGPPLPAVDACGKLRTARGTHDAKAIEELVASNVFNRDRLKDRVGQLGFRAEWGGFFTVTEDGVARFSSGSAGGGRNLAWPWSSAAAPPNGCTAGGKGLFCSTLDTATATAGNIGAFNARVYRATYAAAAALDDGLELVYPSEYDGGNATPCAGKTYDTTYLNFSALGPLSPTTPSPSAVPAWTCDGRLKDGLGEFMKHSQSVQPKTSTLLYKWIDPNGVTIAGNNLNMWGYAVPRCVKLEPPLQTCTRGVCTVVRRHRCFWDEKAIGVPAPGRTAEDAFMQTWGGLGAGSTFQQQGLVYQALASANPATSTVIFEGAAYNQFLSPGKYELINEPGLNWDYYRVPLDVDAVLDGQEILCELDRMSSGTSIPIGLLDLASVETAAEVIKQLAEAINDQAGKMVFARVPKIAADAMQNSGPTGTFPMLSGDMGESVANLRAAILSTKQALPALSSALSSLSVELQSYRVQMEMNSAEKKLVDLETQTEVVDQLISCANALLSGGNILSLGSGGAMACALNARQIGIALKKSALQQDIIEGKDQLAKLAAIDRMSQNATALENAALALEQARESVNASLSRVDGMKKRAKLAVSKALYLNSYQSEAQVAYDSSVGALETLAKKRFDRALKNAKLMSFFAKRAIEQRLGVTMSRLRQDYPLVDAPATWESEACSYGGFQDLADPGAAPSSGTPAPDAWVAKYGEGFIGDYVTKLENFVESYRLTNNFHEGRDTAVISLRDDVANIRAECSAPARNLFASASNMSSPVWAPRFCDPVANGSSSFAGINCISAVPRMDTTTKGPDVAVKAVAGYQDPARGYTFKFGDGGTCATETGGCGWKAGSALGQIVHLLPGTYRVSWFTRDAVSTYINGASTNIVIARNTSGSNHPTLAATTPFVLGNVPAGSSWRRANKDLVVAVEGDYEIGFGVPTGSRPLATAEQEVTIAGPMLEAIRGDRQILLGTFQDTDQYGKASLASCEDTNGEGFRAKRWRRECIRLCNDGFTASCKEGPEHCYYEFDFGISQAAIQSGKLLNYSGFARGNFNYRIESLGINFVGSNVRNCEDAALPSTCYNAGFVPYSLAHDGPFFIRNRAGEDFQTLLFDGRIEHARGLALDRYFTSPISSTDRDLMTDYMRSEFAGRPLDGNFALRVWEDQGIDFKSIQDVQLILNYRYWTAFD